MNENVPPPAEAAGEVGGGWDALMAEEETSPTPFVPPAPVNKIVQPTPATSPPVKIVQQTSPNPRSSHGTTTKHATTAPHTTLSADATLRSRIIINNSDTAPHATPHDEHRLYASAQEDLEYFQCTTPSSQLDHGTPVTFTPARPIVPPGDQIKAAMYQVTSNLLDNMEGLDLYSAIGLIKAHITNHPCMQQLGRPVQVLIVGIPQLGHLTDEIALVAYQVLTSNESLLVQVKVCHNAGKRVTDEPIDVVIVYADAWWSSSLPPMNTFDGKIFFELNPGYILADSSGRV